jgi:peptide/nickel transport system substrate-binding protein
MLQGFRWQLLALIVAVAVFAVVIMTRPDGEQRVVVATEAPMTEVVAQPSATPQPTLAPTAAPQQITVPAQSDGIVTYTEGMVGSVQRLNPLLADLNPVDRDITALIFEGLTTINEYGEVSPQLAEDWIVSFDGLEYVFTLRDDVLWQDGTPFSADDVIYTMSLLKDPNFPGPVDLGQFWRTVETEKISTTLVRFRLTQPLASFPELLRIGILPYHALQGTTSAQLPEHRFNLTPVGTGPYQLEAIRAEDNRVRTVDLRVSPNYRLRPEGQAGYTLERVSFRLYNAYEDILAALEAGEIDGYATLDWLERLPLMRFASQYTPHTGYDPAVGFLVFNWGDDNFELFREERVRRALMTGLDREGAVSRQLSNLVAPADSPLLPLSWAYESDLPYPPYSVQTANNELAVSNIRLGEAQRTDGQLFGFTIIVPDEAALVGLANDIAAQWSQLAVTTDEVTRQVEVNVEPLAPAIYTQRVQDGDFQAAIIELSKAPNADPDVYTFWHQGQFPDGENYGAANNRAVSEALELGRRDANGLHRAIHYDTFQRAFVEHAVALPLYYPLFTYSVTNEIEGVQLGLLGSTADRFNTIKHWQFVDQ